MADDVPISRAPKLACGHRMCHACLKRIFTMSVNDPAHMPPKCCTSDCIPLKYVEKLFDMKFKAKWNRKFQEYTTKNRLYCPAKGCGAWIQPRDIKLDHSSGCKYGLCTRCKLKVCAKCNGKWHSSPECPNDEATLRFAEMAKEEGWQRCYNCSATVELKEGCNHMTCRCTAEFCMICGAQWKSCDCPWFNYAAVENDRLNHLNIAQAREEVGNGGANLNRPRAYHEELERRRDQERQDEAMARGMQGLDLGHDFRPRDLFGIFGVGNAAGHFANDHFEQRATDILTGAYNPAQQAAADRLVAEIRNRQGTGAAMEWPEGEPVQGARRNRAAAMRRAATAGRPAERMVPMRHEPPDYGAEAARHRPAGRNTAPAPPTPSPPPDPVDPAALGDDDEPGVRRDSALAGLGRRTTEGRVDAWRQHVSGDAGTLPLH